MTNLQILFIFNYVTLGYFCSQSESDTKAYLVQQYEFIFKELTIRIIKQYSDGRW